MSLSRLGAGKVWLMRDTQIAGIALARRAALVTRNVEHFQDPNVPVGSIGSSHHCTCASSGRLSRVCRMIGT